MMIAVGGLEEKYLHSDCRPHLRQRAGRLQWGSIRHYLSKDIAAEPGFTCKHERTR
jgi:hypothetical protein